MTDEDPKVVNLDSRRLDKALQNSGGVQVVQLIACSNCQSTDFKLIHDKRIACARCHIEIAPLRWWDVMDPNDQRPTPA